MTWKYVIDKVDETEKEIMLEMGKMVHNTFMDIRENLQGYERMDCINMQCPKCKLSFPVKIIKQSQAENDAMFKFIDKWFDWARNEGADGPEDYQMFAKVKKLLEIKDEG